MKIEISHAVTFHIPIQIYSKFEDGDWGEVKEELHKAGFNDVNMEFSFTVTKYFEKKPTDQDIKKHQGLLKEILSIYT